jgi:hypothetical protein
LSIFQRDNWLMARSDCWRLGNGLPATFLGVPASGFMRKTLKTEHLDVNNGFLLLSAGWIFIQAGMLFN